MRVVELCAGAGGLALGLERAGLDHVLLVDSDKKACATLRYNRPDWNVSCSNIADLHYGVYGEVDVVVGGIPCQPFSFAGKGEGLDDARGTVFYDFARAVSQMQPKLVVLENVKGLLFHDGGKTLALIQSVFELLGYQVEYRVLSALEYHVPQKRERLFIVAARDISMFQWPIGDTTVYTVQDALRAGLLYPTEVSQEEGGAVYSEAKSAIYELVPEGGNWTHLPEPYKSFYESKPYTKQGGTRGLFRRLAWDKPSPTLTTSVVQQFTGRCHPTETRPLSIREYARIQTFPDDWKFIGSMSNQYKQIGNAVPVHLAAAIGRSIYEYIIRCRHA